MASDGLPRSEAMAETSISGAEVPKPTMVSPTTSVGTPKLRASADAPLTSRSAAQISRTKPAASSSSAMVRLIRSIFLQARW
jgi:hypothetical protein